MGARDDLAEWFASLDEVEQAAIAHWVDTGERNLILTLQEASEDLRRFTRLVFGDSIG